MRLLDTESLQTAVMHSGVTLGFDVHDFYGDVWRIIKQAETVMDDAQMPTLERQMRRTMKDYFSHTHQWLSDQEMAHVSDTALPEWRHQVMSARMTLRPYEKQLQRYALCYMYVGRALAQSRHDMEIIAREYAHETHPTPLKITEMTGLLVARAFRQKKEMMAKRDRLIALRAVLEDLQNRFSLLREDLYGVLPGVDVERAYINFRGHLRQGHFGTARAMVEQWANPRLFTTNASKKIVQHNADIIITLVEDNQIGLRVQDGYMLEQSDIGLLFSFLDGDEGRVDTFLRKYLLRFMAYKLRHLLNMGQRLGRIGSLESLLALHTRMVGGIANPMTDMAQIKRHEQEVLGRVTFLLHNGFPDLPPIFNESEVVFDQLRATFREAHLVGPFIRPSPNAE